MLVEVLIPDISENVTSGKVIKVLVKEGDWVEIDDVLIEFETEKALVEIPSTAKGRIVALLARQGQEMRVGDVIARVESEAGGDELPGKKRVPQNGEAGIAADPSAATGPRPPGPTAKTQEASARAGTSEIDAQARSAPAAPSVRRFARELGVDIGQVKGSRPGGRITEADIKAFVRQGRAIMAQEKGPGPIGEPVLPDFSRWGEVAYAEWTGVRGLTARTTATSWRLIPHVTQFDEADISLVEAFLQERAPRLLPQGVKLTVTAVVTKVCAMALLKFPQFNASLDAANQRIILKKYVHIGLAVDTERGLLVPVVRNAEQKKIDLLAMEIADLAARARNKKIKPDEMEGGSFTISNQGGIGGTQFTPIVLWPQVAILGISRSRMAPVHISECLVPRPILPLALSYDHRIIDGADAARFLRWICDALENPLTLHLT
jgi:pyruvate dehydrogenase E2 component (dihydrolipoamide acetyltransferase)